MKRERKNSATHTLWWVSCVWVNVKASERPSTMNKSICFCSLELLWGWRNERKREKRRETHKQKCHKYTWCYSHHGKMTKNDRNDKNRKSSSSRSKSINPTSNHSDSIFNRQKSNRISFWNALCRYTESASVLFVFLFRGPRIRFNSW